MVRLQDGNGLSDSIYFLTLLLERARLLVLMQVSCIYVILITLEFYKWPDIPLKGVCGF